MKTLSGFVDSIKELPTKYPAILSAYIIYSYLFYVMIRFFILAKNSVLTFYDVVEVFDAIPFMWLLAVALVKVIHVRSELHESETQRIVNEQELQIKETQIETMREVVLGMQHQINNPLAIMMLSIQQVKRSFSLPPDLREHFDTIEEESKRISQALKDFSESRKYEIEQISPIVGAMAIPAKR